MLSPREFRDRYEGQLEEKLPDRPITSLRDIQFVYGKLYTLATAGGGEYAAYLTPNEANDLIDEDESLIVVRVDLSGETPSLADDTRGPVWVTKYSQDRVEQVAHCKYAAARGIDHSITHRSGRNSDPEKLARYAKERLTKWATDEVVTATADEHEDGWIVEALAQLGEDETVCDRIEEAVERELGGSTTALLTVQVKLDPDGDYRWPGQVHLFNEAMRARKLGKLVSKGEATDSAGMSTDLLTGNPTRTVGTAEDPLNYYLGKQMEKFPGFDPDQAWRIHSVSEDAAVTIMNAETFVDACTYRAFNTTVYYLPYFLGRVDPEQAFMLYEVLYSSVNDSEDMTPVERAYETLGDSGVDEHGPSLRFYIAAVMKHQMSRYDVYGETLDGSLLYPVELGANHDEVLGTWVFDADGRQEGTLTSPLPTHENWDLLERGQFLGLVASGGYVFRTFPDGDDDSDASVDDLRIDALVSTLSGDPVVVESLLGAYVDRLLEEDGDEFPSFLVASQFAQLCALARTDLLRAETDDAEPIVTTPDYDEPMATDAPRAVADGGQAGHARTRKLEQFIEDTPALREDAERRGAFLLGALVGAVGSYQEWHEDRSTTLVDQYPVKSITATRIKKITQETVGKTLTYTRQEGRSSTKFEWIVDNLRETILEPDPDDWTLDTDDLRFYYALGVTYGMNDRPESTDDQPSDTDIDAE